MKVSEAGTDRGAEIHIYVEGGINPLKEYGGYIDATDHAVCCYVAVEEGNKPRIRGKFAGTTNLIACDAFVDGIHRKSNIYTTKDTRCHKYKKIEFDSFLFVTEDGIIDSQILVTPLDMLPNKSNSQETIGTLELRVYVTRELDVFHEVKDRGKYSISDKSSHTNTFCLAHYNQIPPTFRMDVERNSALISKQSETSYAKRMNSIRPGTEPWAIFRFHYRDKETLKQHDLRITYDATDKKLKQAEPRILSLKPVAPLIAETKLPENGDSPTPSPSLAGTALRGESPFQKPSTLIQHSPNIKANLAANQATPAIEGVNSSKRTVSKTPRKMSLSMESSYTASTEDIDSPALVSTTREPTAATTLKRGFNSFPKDSAIGMSTDGKNSDFEPAPTAVTSTKRFWPNVNEASPSPKRPKPIQVPARPFDESIIPQNTTNSDGSKAIVSETWFDDYCKKLAELRKRCFEKEKELVAIEEEITNCKRWVKEEVDRM